VGQSPIRVGQSPIRVGQNPIRVGSESYPGGSESYPGGSESYPDGSSTRSHDPPWEIRLHTGDQACARHPLRARPINPSMGASHRHPCGREFMEQALNCCFGEVWDEHYRENADRLAAINLDPYLYANESRFRKYAATGNLSASNHI